VNRCDQKDRRERDTTLKHPGSPEPRERCVSPAESYQRLSRPLSAL